MKHKNSEHVLPDHIFTDSEIKKYTELEEQDYEMQSNDGLEDLSVEELS
jgi:hypothetical protein